MQVNGRLELPHPDLSQTSYAAQDPVVNELMTDCPAIPDLEWGWHRSMEQDEAEAAATSAADIAAGVQRPKKKRRKAPYKQPGGRWSKFGKYSSFQVPLLHNSALP